MTQIRLQVIPVKIPLRATFKQASHTRKVSESIFVSAQRGEHLGWGEGCPRTYVTGEDLDSAVGFFAHWRKVIEKEIVDLETLRTFVQAHRAEIDLMPAAWCPIELALIDLFSLEMACPISELLGISPFLDHYQYTAVLASDSLENYQKRVSQFLHMGFQDVKVKVSGDLDLDRSKFSYLLESYKKANREKPRIRIDANNFWGKEVEAAVRYFQVLNVDFWALEEALVPKQYEGIKHLADTLDRPMILDESLCTTKDLQAIFSLTHRFIANLKVSRIGGILRGIQLINTLVHEKIPIIIGAHVGESSILTRAGMLLASHAGTSLAAHEGGFGEMLLEKDPFQPSLTLGKQGWLSLDHFSLKPYGWGLEAKLDMNVEK